MRSCLADQKQKNCKCSGTHNYSVCLPEVKQRAYSVSQKENVQFACLPKQTQRSCLLLHKTDLRPLNLPELKQRSCIRFRHRFVAVVSARTKAAQLPSLQNVHNTSACVLWNAHDTCFQITHSTIASVQQQAQRNCRCSISHATHAAQRFLHSRTHTAKL